MVVSAVDIGGRAVVNRAAIEHGGRGYALDGNRQDDNTHQPQLQQATHERSLVRTKRTRATKGA
jgi:hypothetical protein